MTAAAPISNPLTPSPGKPKVVIGIDLAQRGHEVRKLLGRACGRKIDAAGYDFDDVLQEVYRGILARNHGTSGWDPRRSSFGHYVTMVCTSVFANYVRRESRRRLKERIGMKLPSGETVDACEFASECIAEDGWALDGQWLQGVEADLLQGTKRTPVVRMAVRMLPLLAEGLSRVEIAERLGVSKPQVAQAVRFLKERLGDRE